MRASEVIKAAIDRKGLSIRDLGKLLGVSPGHINRIVNGVEPFPIRLIDDLMRIIDLNETSKKELRYLLLLSHCPEEIKSEFWRMYEVLKDQG